MSRRGGHITWAQFWFGMWVITMIGILFPLPSP